MIAIANIAAAGFSAKAKLNSIGREISQGFEAIEPAEAIMAEAKTHGLNKYLSLKEVNRALKSGADDLPGVLGYVSLKAIEDRKLDVHALFEYAVSGKRKAELLAAHDQWYAKGSKKSRLGLLDALVTYFERVLAKGAVLEVSEPLTPPVALPENIAQMIQAVTLPEAKAGDKELTLESFVRSVVERLMPDLMTTEKGKAMGESNIRALAISMATTTMRDVLSKQELSVLTESQGEAITNLVVPQVLAAIRAEAATKKASAPTAEPQAQPVVAGQHPQIPRVSAPAVKVTEVPVAETQAEEVGNDTVTGIKQRVAEILTSNKVVRGQVDTAMLDKLTEELVAEYRANHTVNTEKDMIDDLIGRYMAAMNAEAEALAQRRRNNGRNRG